MINGPPLILRVLRAFVVTSYFVVVFVVVTYVIRYCSASAA